MFQEENKRRSGRRYAHLRPVVEMLEPRLLLSSDLVNGLVSYWSFDGTANDLVGPNGGTLMEGASLTCGLSGEALSLDGKGYVIVSEASLPEEDMTMVLWMKSSDTSNAGTPVSYAATDEQHNEFTIYDYRDFDLYRQNFGTGPTGESANDGTWHQVVVTWDHESSNCQQVGQGQIELFKDGVKRDSFCLPGSPLTQGGSLVFGQEQDEVGGGFRPFQAFVGLIDEIALYDRVLSAGEIKEAYDDLAPPPPPILSFVTATPAYHSENPFHNGNHDVFVHDGFAYIASKNNWANDGNHSLDILNVADPENPVSVAQVTTTLKDPNNANDILYGINEVVVKEGSDGTFAYVVADKGNAFSIWDVSDLDRPTDFFTWGEGFDDNFEHAHGIGVQGDYAYVVSMGPAKSSEWKGALSVFNVSNPDSIVSVAMRTTDDDIPSVPVDIAVDGDFAYIIGYSDGGTWDNGHTKLTVVDISDPNDPVVEASYDDSVLLEQAHRIEKLGNFVYVVSRGSSPALTIFRADSVDDGPVGTITGSGSPNFLKGASGLAVTSCYAFVASMGEWKNEDGALSIFDVSNPANPTLVEVWQGGGAPYYLEDAYNVFVDGDYVYVSANTEDKTEDGRTVVDFPGGLSIFKILPIFDTDFGDAPDTYGTTLAAGGASHAIVAAKLGTQRDAEPDAQLPLDGNGDDYHQFDDEDGVALETLAALGTGRINVSVTGSSGDARLYGWVDFNGNGQFSDAGELVADGTGRFADLADGNFALRFAVPDTGFTGPSYARFRISTEAGLSYNGAAADGEVEDYAVDILPVSPAMNLSNRYDCDNVGGVDIFDILAWVGDVRANGPYAVPANPTTPPFPDVDGNHFVDIFDALSIILVIRSGGASELASGKSHALSPIVAAPLETTTKEWSATSQFLATGTHLWATHAVQPAFERIVFDVTPSADRYANTPNDAPSWRSPNRIGDAQPAGDQLNAILGEARFLEMEAILDDIAADVGQARRNGKGSGLLGSVIDNLNQPSALNAGTESTICL